MDQFTQRHGELTMGKLEGFDRVVFRGTLRRLNYRRALGNFLWQRQILYKDFVAFAEEGTKRLADHAQQMAAAAGRPYRYLACSSLRKEDLVARILQEDAVAEGLICVLACVEPCRSDSVYRNRHTRKLELCFSTRKCRFFYFYYLHPELGLLHVRLQSWLPWDVQVCLNGRSYLQRQLDREGIGYQKADNCFPWIDDLPRAQVLLEGLTERPWGPTLDGLVAPLLEPLREPGAALAGLEGYYWTVYQSEYATDVMFHAAADLAGVYGNLCRHAIECFHSPDVLRFLGHKPQSLGQRELTSDLQRRVEGVRVKHRFGANSLKMYDKQGSVLRIETTINDPSVFRVYRRPESRPEGPLRWRPMRKGIADIARRVQFSRAANARYLEALAAVNIRQPAQELLDAVSRPVRAAGQSVRGLRPVSPEDAAFFAAVLRGEHLPHGLSSADVQSHLFTTPARTGAERLRRSRYVGHQLRLLRRHGLLQKVPKRRLYQITPKGHQLMSLATILRQANAKTLLAA